MELSKLPIRSLSASRNIVKREHEEIVTAFSLVLMYLTNNPYIYCATINYIIIIIIIIITKTSVEAKRVGGRISISTIVVDKPGRFNYTEMYFRGYYSFAGD